MSLFRVQCVLLKQDVADRLFKTALWILLFYWLPAGAFGQPARLQWVETTVNVASNGMAVVQMRFDGTARAPICMAFISRASRNSLSSTWNAVMRWICRTTKLLWRSNACLPPNTILFWPRGNRLPMETSLISLNMEPISEPAGKWR